MTVIFVLHVPEEFETSTEVKVTIISQIYQAITRAQVQLLIVSDDKSISYLKTYMSRLLELFSIEEV